MPSSSFIFVNSMAKIFPWSSHFPLPPPPRATILAVWHNCAKLQSALCSILSVTQCYTLCILCYEMFSIPSVSVWASVQMKTNLTPVHWFCFNRLAAKTLSHNKKKCKKKIFYSRCRSALVSRWIYLEPVRILQPVWLWCRGFNYLYWRPVVGHIFPFEFCSFKLS